MMDTRRESSSSSSSSSLSVVCLQLCFVISPVTTVAAPSPPTNLTLESIFDSGVVVTWDSENRDDIVQFEMTLRCLGPMTYLAEVTQGLDGHKRSYLVQPLEPATEYQLSMYSRNEHGLSNVSDVLTFRTLEESPELYAERLVVNPGEVIVVAIILVAWICAIALFLHKWGKIRILQSAESRYNHCPKNLHTIKVVKRPTDSVIYKNYTKEVSSTMAARQKRFERMHTMPNIKVKTEDILAAQQEEQSEAAASEGPSQQQHKDAVRKTPRPKNHAKFKAFSRTITSPVLEIEEPRTSSA